MNRRQFMRGAVISGAAAATTRRPGWLVRSRRSGWTLGAIVCRVGADGLKLPTISSKQSGPWSNASTWNLGRVPTPSDVVEIKHNVRLDVSTTVSGVLVQPAGVLRFTADETNTLRSRTGTWSSSASSDAARSRPRSSTAHVRGHRRDEVRRRRRRRPRLRRRPLGHGRRQADPRRHAEEVLEPYGQRSDVARQRRAGRHPHGYGDGVHDESLFKSFNKGSKVPTVKMSDGTTFTAEVLNLTRNVRVEGTPGGRAHVFVMSSAAQTVRYAALRYLGPRQKDGTPPSSSSAGTGCTSTSATTRKRDVTIESVVVRDTGSHAFVAAHVARHDLPRMHQLQHVRGRLLVGRARGPVPVPVQGQDQPHHLRRLCGRPRPVRPRTTRASGWPGSSWARATRTRTRARDAWRSACRATWTRPASCGPSSPTGRPSGTSTATSPTTTRRRGPPCGR